MIHLPKLLLLAAFAIASASAAAEEIEVFVFAGQSNMEGADSRVEAMMRRKCGWMGFLLPQWSAIFKTLCEKLLAHLSTQKMLATCRREADKRILGTDAQYSPLLSVVNQVRHGRRKQREESPSDVHALLTVQCAAQPFFLPNPGSGICVYEVFRLL